MILDIISLSDALDNSGLYSFADELDELAKEYAKKVPDEKFAKIFSDIKNAIISSAQESEKIDKDTLDLILKTIDNVYIAQYGKPKYETYIPSEQEAIFASKEATDLAKHMAETIRSIMDIKEEIKSAGTLEEKNEAEEQLKSELSKHNYEKIMFDQLDKKDQEAIQKYLAAIQEYGPVGDYKEVFPVGIYEE